MNPLRPLLIATQFLTRLPVRLDIPPEGKELGVSLLCYPAVGLIIGLILLGLSESLAGMGGLLPAALVLAVWVIITGALHLDGLADSADAWAGGLGDRERTLAIMKDPRSGPVALIVVMLVLLLKVAALERLLLQKDGLALVLAPTLGRTAPVLLFLTVPYVRPGGLGEALSRHLPRRAAMLAVFMVMLAATLAARERGLWLLLALSGLFLAMRSLLIGRIGGTTGDTAGALVELTECASLISLALTC